MALKTHGITANSVQNLLFSAGAIYKNLIQSYELTSDSTIVEGKTYYTRSGTSPNYVYTPVAEPSASDISTYYEYKGWTGTVLGATNGGIKFSITPEYVDAELDGASVAVRGTKIKVGETATLESNMTEFSEGVIKDSLHLVEDTTESVSGYKKYISKRSLVNSDYLTNIAYVGALVSGEQIIVILPNAICTSALEVQGQNKTQATYTITFECTATFEQDDLEHLPYEIYYPQTTQVNG